MSSWCSTLTDSCVMKYLWCEVDSSIKSFLQVCQIKYWCPIDQVLNPPPLPREKSGIRSSDLAGHVIDMMQLYAMPRFHDGTIYHQDGAPLNFANIVSTFLYEEFPARLIGRGSLYMWPADYQTYHYLNFTYGDLQGLGLHDTST